MEQVPYTIIGGGVCGILVALKLKNKHPEADVLLLEKESYIGHHNTTRNSGVLHAGIYYSNGSLKHKLCRAGYTQWLSLASTHNIPINICGKYIVATKDYEIPTLENILVNGNKNGVPNLQPMSDLDLHEISDFCSPIKGIFSPITGILDISSGVNILRDEFLRLGGLILMNTEVLNISENKSSIQVETAADKFLTTHLINCAGLDSVRLRKHLGLNDIENLFVKGNYLKLNKPYYNKKLIYPIPSSNLHGLGVHTSFHLDGIIRFGPNTEDIIEPHYQNSEDNIHKMYPAIAEKFKNIKIEDLSPDYSGVRTKILKNGKLHSDFLLQSPPETKIAGYYEMLGIESPGMTAAPALADHLIDSMAL